MSDLMATATTVDMVKPWWTSKTLWLNALVILVFGLWNLVDAGVVTNPHTVAILGVAAAVLNMLVRVLGTSTALGATDQLGLKFPSPAVAAPNPLHGQVLQGDIPPALTVSSGASTLYAPYIPTTPPGTPPPPA